MSTLFLFGAGASYGSLDVTPQPPPLGASLFDELRKQGGSACRNIDEKLAEKFRLNFENGMAEYCKKNDGDVVEFLKETALYFAKFRSGPKNLYRKVIHILNGCRKKAIFATTNYDLLIEHSIDTYNDMLISNSINKNKLSVIYPYMPTKKNSISVIKIHGSCNFLPDPEILQVTRMKFISPAEKHSIIRGLPIKPVSQKDVITYCRSNNSLPPAISIYTKGKKVLTSPDFINDQQKLFSKEVKNAARIFVIGLAVNPDDNHIWSVLANAKCYLGWVGKEGEIFEAWRKKNKLKDAHIIGATFTEALHTIDKKINNTLN